MLMPFFNRVDLRIQAASVSPGSRSPHYAPLYANVYDFATPSPPKYEMPPPITTVGPDAVSKLATKSQSTEPGKRYRFNPFKRGTIASSSSKSFRPVSSTDPRLSAFKKASSTVTTSKRGSSSSSSSSTDTTGQTRMPSTSSWEHRMIHIPFRALELLGSPVVYVYRLFKKDVPVTIQYVTEDPQQHPLVTEICQVLASGGIRYPDCDPVNPEKEELFKEATSTWTVQDKNGVKWKRATQGKDKGCLFYLAADPTPMKMSAAPNKDGTMDISYYTKHTVGKYCPTDDNDEEGIRQFYDSLLLDYSRKLSAFDFLSNTKVLFNYTLKNVVEFMWSVSNLLKDSANGIESVIAGLKKVKAAKDISNGVKDFADYASKHYQRNATKERFATYFSAALSSYQTHSAIQDATDRVLQANYRMHGEISPMTADHIIEAASSSSSSSSKRKSKQDDDTNDSDSSYYKSQDYHPRRTSVYSVGAAIHEDEAVEQDTPMIKELREFRGRSIKLCRDNVNQVSDMRLLYGDPELYWVINSILEYLDLFHDGKAVQMKTEQDLLDEVYGFIKRSRSISQLQTETASGSMASSEAKNKKRAVGDTAKMSRQASGDHADLVFKYTSLEIGCLEIGFNDGGPNATKELQERDLKAPKMMKAFYTRIMEQFPFAQKESIKLIGFIISGMHISAVQMSFSLGSVSLVSLSKRYKVPESVKEIPALLPPVLALVYNCALIMKSTSEHLDDSQSQPPPQTFFPPVFVPIVSSSNCSTGKKRKASLS
ncbi:hypothetical protein V8B55DRAFT_1563177 [Mucor lusitanicus]